MYWVLMMLMVHMYHNDVMKVVCSSNVSWKFMGIYESHVCMYVQTYALLWGVVIADPVLEYGYTDKSV